MTVALPAQVLEQAAAMASLRSSKSILSCDLVAWVWRTRTLDAYFGGQFDRAAYPAHTQFVKQLAQRWADEMGKPLSLAETAWRDHDAVSHMLRTTEERLKILLARCSDEPSDPELAALNRKYRALSRSGKPTLACISLEVPRLEMPPDFTLGPSVLSNEVVMFVMCLPFCSDALLGARDAWMSIHTAHLAYCSCAISFSTANRYLISAGVDVEAMAEMIRADLGTR